MLLLIATSSLIFLLQPFNYPLSVASYNNLHWKETLSKQVIGKFIKNRIDCKVISCHTFSERRPYSIKPNS